MAKVLFFLAQGFEELEFVAPWDILKRGGVECVVASISDQLEVLSARHLVIRADCLMTTVSAQNFDLVVLPGGGLGTENLRAHPDVQRFLSEMIQAHKLVAAICAAPLVLADAGLLEGKKATCFPSCAEELVRVGACTYQTDDVVTDGLLITSKGAGTATEFGFALLARLQGKSKSQDVRSQMQFSCVN